MTQPVVEPDVERFYANVYTEDGRLVRSAHGRAEFVRTQELLRRLLPAPPATVLDVGGGPGAHARWLSADGYAVHLIDLVPSHARQARGRAGVSASVGDARRLPVGSRTVDAVVMLGPLYHLTGRADRIAALREAIRVTRPGGLVAAAAISRNSALIDLTRQRLITPAKLPRLLEAYATGVHAASAGFTTAYFHRPEELAADLIAAGLPEPEVFGIEGPLWPLLDEVDAQVTDQVFRDAMTCARTFETDPAVIGTSSHLLAAARVPSGGPPR